MNPLQELAEHGQSYWLDNLTRDMIEQGQLARRVDQEGLRGVTSNPAIFHKAISGSGAYDPQIESLARRGFSAQQTYEALVIRDIRSACDILMPVHEATEGVDGFVSLEVSPYLVHDAQSTMEEARRLFRAVERPNLFIKIPGSPPGFRAIEEMLFEGINVNVTLLFSIDAYQAVARAYLRAMERRLEEGRSLGDVASVASFFLSRIDVLVDALLGQRISPGRKEPKSLGPAAFLGRAAVANAKLAYRSFTALFQGDRWTRLSEAGARVQRVLWASTSTKNPLYSDVRYIEPLIGPHTVNTLPDESIAAFADHGRVRPGTVEEGLAEAEEVMAGLARLGIDFDSVTWQLLNEGMEKFTAPYDRLLNTLEEKRRAVVGSTSSGADFVGLEMEDALAAQSEKRFGPRLFAGDTTLWTLEEDTAATIANRLGWLDSIDAFEPRVREVCDIAQELNDEGIRWVVLLGMGGSSLWPEVSTRVFGSPEGWPGLKVLDSTDPQAVLAVERSIDLDETAFVVASKSGTTTETLCLYRYFFAKVQEAQGKSAGARFLAITDPGSPLEKEAEDQQFRHLFSNPEDIGGRYSALSYFGLVPMALQGLDPAAILDSARHQLASCDPALPAATNSGISLGTALGSLARDGRDKLTILADPRLEPFSLWLEQLVAESTGKDGTGILPVVGEPLGQVDALGDDRVFVHLSVQGEENPAAMRFLDSSADRGHPVIRIKVDGPYGLGAEIVRWEVATATAGAVLGVNPFDEPNVTESKRNTRQLLDRWSREGGVGTDAPTASDGTLQVWAGVRSPNSGSPLSILRQTVDQIQPGDYLALLPFLHPVGIIDDLFNRLRGAVGRMMRVPTTLGYGPRYLHSTGQLHKGGPETGVFLIFTADTGPSLAIPGEDHDFATLLRAQALGDFRALAERDRRVVRVHLGKEVGNNLERVVEALL